MSRRFESQEIEIARTTSSALLRILPLVDEALCQDPFKNDWRDHADFVVSSLREFNNTFPQPGENYNTHSLKALTEGVYEYLIDHPNIFGVNSENEFRGVWWNLFRSLKSNFNLPDVGTLQWEDQANCFHSAVRFLPGFRHLEWSKKTTSSKSLIFTGQNAEVMHFQNGSERGYFIASTGGAEVIDHHLSNPENYGKVTVTNLIEGLNINPTQINEFVFDKDGTLTPTPDMKREPEQIDKFNQISRGQTLRSLAQKGKLRLWTRNFGRNAEEFAKQVEEEDGVRLDSLTHFGNWPFIDMRATGPRDVDIRIHPQSQIKGTLLKLNDPVVNEIMKYSASVIKTKDSDDPEFVLDNLSQMIHGYLEKAYSSSFAFASPMGEILLETKAPLFLAMGNPEFSDEDRVNLIQSAVLINDRFHSAVSANTFGYNFIHLAHPTHLEKLSTFIP